MHSGGTRAPPANQTSIATREKSSIDDYSCFQMSGQGCATFVRGGSDDHVGAVLRGRPSPRGRIMKAERGGHGGPPLHDSLPVLLLHDFRLRIKTDSPRLSKCKRNKDVVNR